MPRPGSVDFGENKVQEALQKMDAGADMEMGWHLIGHLQSNKAKKAAAAVHCDSRHRQRGPASPGGSGGGGRRARSVEVLVQVDLALEPTKHGAAVDEVPAIFAAADDVGPRTAWG